MVPVDGGYTLNQAEMIEVLQQIKPKIAVPMHVFTQATLDKFLAPRRPNFIPGAAGPTSPSVVLTPRRIAGNPGDACSTGPIKSDTSR